MSPVFEGAGRARYYLRLRPILGDRQTAPSNTLGPFHFSWDPSEREPWSAQGLRPALYELMLLRRTSDAYRMTGTSAWILVSAPGGYEKANAAFGEAQSVARRSGNSADPDAAEALLRACLETLAQEQVK